MGRKKPRPKLDPKKYDGPGESDKKKEKDWGFDDIARSKTRRR